jgi:menaquinone-9 beta-reductase
MINVPHKQYDVAVIGGGLAGLSLSILLAKSKYRVCLFEKEKYPFHKVCGEYISFESWDFLQSLGVPLSDWKLPEIRRLLVSAPNGKCVEHDLMLGGFGLSRYILDSTLAEIAKKSGVVLLEQNKVNDVEFDNFFTIRNGGETVEAKLVCGSFGKRSNLDIKWKRPFTQGKNNRFNNYVGVKYHIRIEAPKDLIALHNFKHGYCGLSKIEGDDFCLCYMTTAENIQANENSIKKMEKNVLQKNPFLQKIFSEATFLFSDPLTISQISFEKKSLVENNILFIGDAAGMITPLCGNGMSMALHGSKIAHRCIDDFLQNKTSRQNMEKRYLVEWEQIFAKRIRIGRMIQGFFGSELLSNIMISSLKPFPKFIAHLIKQTHGEPF